MNELVEVVERYLSKHNTNFSLLITGGWGAGKTYYIQNHLFENIQDEMRLNKEISVIYVSLNGISKIEEISEQIILNRLKINNKANVGYGLVKSAINILGSVPGLSSGWFGDALTTAVDGAKNIANTILNFDNYVIVLDDLERLDPELRIEKVMGFLNTNLLEKGIKTLLVANESELLNNSNYAKIKEKFIERTVVYKQDIKEMLLPFVNTFLDKEKLSEVIYYIEHDMDEIKRLIQVTGCENLRTLRFSIENFASIFSVLSHHNLTKLHIREIFMCTLTLSMQYKLGLSKLNESAENLRSCHSKERMEQSIKEAITQNQELTYAQAFYRDYLLDKEAPWIFYSSIYDFVSFGALNEEWLNQEYSMYKMYVADECEEKLRKLQKYEELELDELRFTFDEILRFAGEGIYSTWTYVSLAEKLIAFKEKGLIETTIEDNYELLKSGMQISTKREYNLDKPLWGSYIHFFGPGIKNSYYEKLYYLHKQSWEKYLTDKAKYEFDTKIMKSIKTLDETLIKESQLWVLNGEKVFSGMDPEVLSKVILDMPNKNIRMLYNLMESRFPKDAYKSSEQKYKGEKENIVLLKEKLTIKMDKNQLDPLKRHNIMSFIELLKQCIKNISGTNDE